MNAEAFPIAKFRLGRIVTTPEAREVLADEDILMGIIRHQSGDWGELELKDQQANDRALVERTRILSAYRSARGVRFWLVTEADRRVTTVHLPDGY